MGKNDGNRTWNWHDLWMIYRWSLIWFMDGYGKIMGIELFLTCFDSSILSYTGVEANKYNRAVVPRSGRELVSDMISTFHAGVCSSKSCPQLVKIYLGRWLVYHRISSFTCCFFRGKFKRLTPSIFINQGEKDHGKATRKAKVSKEGHQTSTRMSSIEVAGLNWLTNAKCSSQMCHTIFPQRCVVLKLVSFGNYSKAAKKTCWFPTDFQGDSPPQPCENHCVSPGVQRNFKEGQPGSSAKRALEDGAFPWPWGYPKSSIF